MNTPTLTECPHGPDPLACTVRECNPRGTYDPFTEDPPDVPAAQPWVADRTRIWTRAEPIRACRWCPEWIEPGDPFVADVTEDGMAVMIIHGHTGCSEETT